MHSIGAFHMRRFAECQNNRISPYFSIKSNSPFPPVGAGAEESTSPALSRLSACENAANREDEEVAGKGNTVSVILLRCILYKEVRNAIDTSKQMSLSLRLAAGEASSEVAKDTALTASNKFSKELDAVSQAFDGVREVN